MVDREASAQDRYENQESRDILTQASLVLYRTETVDQDSYYIAIALAADPRKPPAGLEEKERGLRVWVVLPRIKKIGRASGRERVYVLV